MYSMPPKKWNQRKAAAPAPYYAAVESSDSEVSDASGQPKKKRKDKTVATLSEPEEEIMLEWLRKHPEFYNRRMMEYKNVQRKETLWREKASDMGKSVEHLKTWYRSMRTRMARLLRKSSKPNEELTERDTWVIENFIFLRKHIEAVHRRPMKSVTQRPAPTASHGPLHPVITVKSEATSGTAETPVSTTSMSPVPRIPELKRPGEQDNGVASTLGDLTNHIMTMQHHLINRLQPLGDQERLAFCEWVRATLVGLDHGVWRRSQKEITDILFRSIAENDAAGEWPSQVPNPTAVWGSTNQERPQQQTDHVGFECSVPQSQVQVPPRPSSAPPATSTGGSPDFSQDVSGFISNLLRNFDTRYNLQDTS
ncbi:Hypp468 [Branchiostoma lanceolatum]|uniref:Hypp468 protein n=1 Tax=Branchiostoma lanceolatum TaxID=7740 RepID=A0A8J9YL44_BRALA|nr:Hypp468 [Branchiostoma lanceolatum]